MIIPIDAGKVSDKIQHLLMIKNTQKIRKKKETSSKNYKAYVEKTHR